MALGSTQPLTQMSTRNVPVGKGRPGRKADNLIDMCEPIVYKMWEPRRLTSLWASTACNICRRAFSHGKIIKEIPFKHITMACPCNYNAHRQIYRLFCNRFSLLALMTNFLQLCNLLFICLPTLAGVLLTRLVLRTGVFSVLRCNDFGFWTEKDLLSQWF
jgi:hypothetical protein